MFTTSQVAHRLRVGLALAIFWSYRRGRGCWACGPGWIALARGEAPDL